MINPEPGETPMDALLRMQGESTKVFEWDESNLVPATDAEMRAGIREAMEKFAHLLPSPDEDTCDCLTCRSFRAYIAPR